MRKMLAVNARKDGGQVNAGANVDPYEEDDIGKRF